jgi:dolichol-phosphate mannosyltransferase
VINSRWTWAAAPAQPAPAARPTIRLAPEEPTAMRTLVIIPTYNERENIGRLVPEILRQDDRFDVLVVDDGSPDGTGQIARSMAARSHRVHLLQRAGKQGLGSAYLAGFRRALSWGYHTVVEMDADFSHSPADLPRVVAPVRAGEADLSLGSRWAKGGGTCGWPLRRQILSRGGSLYARAILGVGVRDLTGGFKCFSRRALNAIELDSVRSNGYSFQIELTYRAIQARMRVVEVPIIFTERERGVSKMSGAIVREALGVVWKLRLDGARPAAEPQRELMRAAGGEEETL